MARLRPCLSYCHPAISATYHRGVIPTGAAVPAEGGTSQQHEPFGRSFTPPEKRLCSGKPTHACPDTEESRAMETLTQDIRHAVRVLRRSPAFTSVSILTL